MRIPACPVVEGSCNVGVCVLLAGLYGLKKRRVCAFPVVDGLFFDSEVIGELLVSGTEKQAQLESLIVVFG